ncbi:DUF3622 domain-containing protein [Thalassotalea aquiviva]|uniref:DUF3622 domain-containing protein n=1 Tax=Thalassotalea aquiviva TaxID=3242415 RepID=UPI00352B8A2A
MSKSPKYTFRVSEKRNNTWTAEIQRQATSSKKVVSKRQTGFATKDEASAWAEQHLAQLIENLVNRNKERDQSRLQQYSQKQQQKQTTATTNKALNEPHHGKEQDTVDGDVDADELDNNHNEVMFDFERELLEQEAPTTQGNKKKTKVKARKSAKEQAIADKDALKKANETVDGSEAVNDIYRQK